MIWISKFSRGIEKKVCIGVKTYTLPYLLEFRSFSTGLSETSGNRANSIGSVDNCVAILLKLDLSKCLYSRLLGGQRH